MAGAMSVISRSFLYSLSGGGMVDLSGVATAFHPPGGWLSYPSTARVERPLSFLYSSKARLRFFFAKDTHVGLCAAVERGPSQGTKDTQPSPLIPLLPSAPALYTIAST